MKSKKRLPRFHRLKNGADFMVRRGDLFVMVEVHTDAAFLQTFVQLPWGKLAAALRSADAGWSLVRLDKAAVNATKRTRKLSL